MERGLESLGGKSRLLVDRPKRKVWEIAYESDEHDGVGGCSFRSLGDGKGAKCLSGSSFQVKGKGGAKKHIRKPLFRKSRRDKIRRKARRSGALPAGEERMKL